MFAHWQKLPRLISHYVLCRSGIRFPGKAYPCRGIFLQHNPGHCWYTYRLQFEADQDMEFPQMRTNPLPKKPVHYWNGPISVNTFSDQLKWNASYCRFREKSY